MFKGKFGSFISGVVLGSLLVSGVGFASSSMNIEVFTDSLRYVFHGEEVTPSDKPDMYYNGKTYVPSGFIYQGTTYVPLRFIGESLGNEVGWDGTTRTITISKPEPVITYQELAVEQAPQAVQNWVNQSRNMELAQSMTTGDKTYLLVTRGKKKTGGYGVEITNITEQEHQIKATVNYTEPGDFVTQVITYPYTLVEIEKTNKEITFTGSNDTFIPQLVGIDHLSTVIAGSQQIKLFEPTKQKTQLIIQGVAQVHEGAIDYQLKNAQGDTVKSGFVQTQAGAGHWGYYTLVLPNEEWNQDMTLELYTTSAKDGSMENQVKLSLKAY